ncbi:hypothetical protein ABZV60_16815 [Streptomyces sp. NPDC004787]|uniref:hypothetical protein n=1 Tax=Streptomyces sp. NPDC004787 TaxID=3154291 RepID=UPI0033ADCCE8
MIKKIAVALAALGAITITLAPPSYASPSLFSTSCSPGTTEIIDNVLLKTCLDWRMGMARVRTEIFNLNHEISGQLAFTTQEINGTSVSGTDCQPKPLSGIGAVIYCTSDWRMVGGSAGASAEGWIFYQNAWRRASDVAVFAP